MMDLDATPGGATSNAYATLEEAEAYMATLEFRGKWDGADDERKSAALIQAARWMDTLQWLGRKATREQALAWPREGVTDTDGYEVPKDEVPQRVREANAEFAFRLLASDRAADADKGISIGSLRTPDETRALVPPSVVDLVRPYLGSKGSIRLVRS
jgi:hypothetical protein